MSIDTIFISDNLQTEIDRPAGRALAMQGAVSMRAVEFPNNETIAAMLEARRGDVQSYGSVERMIKDANFRRCVSARKSYISKSRQFRNDCYIRIKNEIRAQSKVLGGIFATDNLIESNRSQIGAYFLGRKRKVVYILNLETTYSVYRKLVTKRALSQLNPDAKLDQLRNCLKLIANSGEISVCERWSLGYNYKYGVGLHAIIETLSLEAATINQFVVRFLQNEEAFQAENHISYKHDEVGSWGLEPTFFTNGEI